MAILNRRQFKTAIVLQSLMIVLVGSFTVTFWNIFCDSGIGSCLPDKWPFTPIVFLLICLVRPFLFTPLLVVALMSGSNFSPILGTILTATGATVSCLVVFFIGRFLGSFGVRPWLSSNLPATWELLKTQDYKIVFFTRWIPIFPFDLMTILFGSAAFRLWPTLIATFLGVLPEAYVFNQLANSKEEFLIIENIIYLVEFGAITLLPLIIFEVLFRHKGSSLWHQIKRTYQEIIYEIRANNEIVKRRSFDNSKTPVILLYGFFSSRKVLTIMERLMTQRGFEVMSFNLGGMLGVFFTRGIRETARHIDSKIEGQMKRHGFDKVHVIAHSKGGMVALWWILKLGGSRYCEKVITMGTPFKGTYLTYLGLCTPLGFFWRDLWQMRPNSPFLKELHAADIPDSVSIYCLYSENDKVATGNKGVFTPIQSPERITKIPLHHVSHFEFLFRRDVADNLARLLRQKPSKAIDKSSLEPKAQENSSHDNNLYSKE